MSPSSVTKESFENSNAQLKSEIVNYPMSSPVYSEDVRETSDDKKSKIIT